MRRSRALSAVAAAGVFAFAPAARANGRFPGANQLVSDPVEGRHLVVRSTVGVVQSFDGGFTFRVICDVGVGYTGIFDPPLAVVASGDLLAGLPDDLVITRDKGCSFPSVGAPLAGKDVLDLAVDPANPHRAVALTATFVGGISIGTVAETIDDGKTWKQLGPNLPEDFFPITLELAKTVPKRIYLSGRTRIAGKVEGTMLRSDDHGDTWTQTMVGDARVPFIAAVAPDDADRVYVRMFSDSADALRLSTDGAVSFKEVMAFKGAMLGFSLDPTGKQVAIGGPSDGVQIASVTDLVFTRTGNLSVQCLAWTTDGLWGCGNEGLDGFAVGISHDQGKTFEKRFTLKDLLPVDCSPSSPTVRKCTPDAGPPDAAPDAPDATSDIGTDASAPTTTSSSHESCGRCSTPGRQKQNAPEPWSSSAFLVALAVARRRWKSRRTL